MRNSTAPVSYTHLIVITPIIPSNIVSQIEKAIKDGKKYDYYPTYYRLSLNNGALKISVSQAQSLLTELVEQFRVRFNKKYVNQTQVNNIINLDFTELEYVDIYQLSLIHIWMELAEKALENLAETSYAPLYKRDEGVLEKIEKICYRVYGASAVEYAPDVLRDLRRLDESPYRDFYICMAKTPNSITCLLYTSRCV